MQIVIFGSFWDKRDKTQLNSGGVHSVTLPCSQSAGERRALGARRGQPSLCLVRLQGNILSCWSDPWEKFMREEVWGRFGDCSFQKQAELHNHLKQLQSDLFSSGQTSELRRHTGIYNSLRSDWLIAFAVAVVSSPVTHLSPVPLIFSCTSTAKYPLPIHHHVLCAEICQQVWNGFAWIQDLGQEPRLSSRKLCLFCSG